MPGPPERDGLHRVMPMMSAAKRADFIRAMTKAGVFQVI